MSKKLLASVATLIALTNPAATNANVILDFENPLPGGLTPMSFWQGTPVPDSAKVTDQYLSDGLLISGAALVQLPAGSVPSGTNGLAGFDGNNQIDYDAVVTFTFFQPGNSGVVGTTDFFAYSPDLWGSSGNTITISAFGLDNSLIGQATYIESGTITSPLSISGVGQFHRVTVDQTLYNTQSGGIALDLVQFGTITPMRSVPEPETYALLILGLGLLGILSQRGRSRVRLLRQNSDESQLIMEKLA